MVVKQPREKLNGEWFMTLFAYPLSFNDSSTESVDTAIPFYCVIYQAILLVKMVLLIA